jgi:hypothetical protein
MEGTDGALGRQDYGDDPCPARPDHYYWHLCRPSASHLEPGLAPDRGQGVVDRPPTGAAGVGR